MEIREYLQVLWRKAWIIVLVPVLAGGAAFAISVREPQTYRAAATVIVPLAGAQTAPPAAVGQFVASYRAVLMSPPVIQAVAKATKVPSKRVRGGLDSAQIGASGIISTSYTDTVPGPVGEVLQTAIRQTLIMLAQPKVEAAKEKVRIAQKELDEAQTKITEFRAATGLVLPNEEYRVAAGELSQLKVILQQARVAPEPDQARIAGLQRAVDEAVKRAETIGGQVTEFRSIDNRFDRASGNLDKAQDELGDAEGQLAADTADAGISIGATAKVPRESLVRRRVQSVTLTALVLAIGFVLLLESLNPRRPARRPSASDLEDFARATERHGGPPGDAIASPVASRSSTGH